MNNSQFKKDDEFESLQYFLERYQEITEKIVEVSAFSERPDFICSQNDGMRIGIELVKIRRGHPNDILFDQIIHKENFMSPENAIEMLQIVAIEKEIKRKQNDWKLPDSTILLVELLDIPLAMVEKHISVENTPDIFTTNFLEFWIADYTEIEKYDNVELFCAYPSHLFGYYPRAAQKPYG